MGAMGKSAQFLLHTWLPDAMEGPTPVSALIHAATMVTAGVFMVARLSPLFELAPNAKAFVLFIGATTAIFAATVGLVQNDIKRIVAYSTCSQLGYMFVAMGSGAYSIGMFHLFTHAFFKALLFLGCGSVILAMHHEQDIRKMGGLWRKIPFTYATMVIGTLALTGFPFTAGFFSKDAIIEADDVISRHGRQLRLHHDGRRRGADGVLFVAAHFQDLPRRAARSSSLRSGARKPADDAGAARRPGVRLDRRGLAVRAHFRRQRRRGILPQFAGDQVRANHVLEDMEHLPLAVTLAPTVMMIGGFLVAWQFYIRRPDIPEALARDQAVLYRFLLNAWYFDRIYDFLFVRPVLWLGRLFWKGGDGFVIDGFGPDGVSARVLDVTRNVVRLQTGYLYHYAFAMLIGVAAFVTWFMFAGPH